MESSKGTGNSINSSFVGTKLRKVFIKIGIFTSFHYICTLKKDLHSNVLEEDTAPIPIAHLHSLIVGRAGQAQCTYRWATRWNTALTFDAR